MLVMKKPTSTLKKSFIPKQKHWYKHKEKLHHINETMHIHQHTLCGQTLLNIDFQIQLPHATSAISKSHVKPTYHTQRQMSKRYYTFLFKCYGTNESTVPGATQKQNKWNMTVITKYCRQCKRLKKKCVAVTQSIRYTPSNTTACAN